LERPARHAQIITDKKAAMKIKIIPSKRQLVTLLHILFWFISFNFWNVILNPGVESTTVIEGYEVEWELIMLVNFDFLLFCSVPFIWLIRKKWLWLKILLSTFALATFGYFIIKSWSPDNDGNDAAFILAYFSKNFMYVVIFHLSIIAAVYFNLKVLIGNFLGKSRFMLYLIYFSGLCILTALLNFSMFDYFVDKLFPSLYYISYFRIWELILIVAAYLIFTSIIFLMWQYAQMLIEKRDAARNELSALKAQINPHFLFNNLNTIYSMATQKDERTAGVVLKLSDFLRYVLYDTSDETIPLEKEIEIIRTYVDLQKERADPNITQIELITEGQFKGAHIAPLLLLPLAENCFKHGKGKDPGLIRIRIDFDGKALHFQTTNPIVKHEKIKAEKNGGIGISNVEKRLELIYPEHQLLDYGEKDGVFRLEMSIELIK
jgi:sensor histidine kinase YesM